MQKSTANYGTFGEKDWLLRTIPDCYSQNATRPAEPISLCFIAVAPESTRKPARFKSPISNSFRRGGQIGSLDDCGIQGSHASSYLRKARLQLV
jgi:hypothetical protein